jgi:hypothetical protein
MDAIERGRKTLQEALADPATSAEDKAVYEQMLKSDKACARIGADGLRQDEFSRKMALADDKWNKAERWHGELDTFHKTVKSELDEGRAARNKLAELETTRGSRTIASDGSTGDSDGAKIDTSKFVTREDLDRLARQQVDYATNYGAFMAQLATRHYQEFSEVLDASTLLAFCREKQLTVDGGGYDSFVYEKRAARVKKQNEDALKDAEERGFRRGLSESGASAPPYPVGSGAGADESMTLAGLDPAKKTQFGVEAAVQRYNTEIRKKAGIGA